MAYSKRITLSIAAVFLAMGIASAWNRWRTPRLVWEEVPLAGDDLFGVPPVATLPLNFALENATEGGEQPWIREMHSKLRRGESPISSTKR